MAKMTKSKSPAPHPPTGVFTPPLPTQNVLNRPASFMSKASLAKELDVPERDILKLVERGVIPKPADLPGIGPRWDWELCRLALAGGVGAIIAEDPYLVGARNATASR